MNVLTTKADGEAAVLQGEKRVVVWSSGGRQPNGEVGSVCMCEKRR